MWKTERVALFLFLIAPFSAPSATVLIETRDSQTWETMDFAQRVRIVSVETGLMDSLFDHGHIFFNVYTHTKRSAKRALDQTALNFATEEGAQFLLILMPNKLGVNWRLYEVSEKNLLIRNFSALNKINPELKPRDRWLALGGLLAEDIVNELR